jgi:hypothetical protein
MKYKLDFIGVSSEISEVDASANFYGEFNRGAVEVFFHASFGHLFFIRICQIPYRGTESKPRTVPGFIWFQ